MSDYPRMMYRDGGEDEVWGCPVETRVVHSVDEEADATGQGWRREVLAPEPGELHEVLEPAPKRRGRPPKTLAPIAEVE